jgi:hypothetical protein
MSAGRFQVGHCQPKIYYHPVNPISPKLEEPEPNRELLFPKTQNSKFKAQNSNKFQNSNIKNSKAL